MLGAGEGVLVFDMVVFVGRVLLELALAIGLVLYTFRRFGPPQYSDPSPLQAIEHPLFATTEPAFRLLPQKPKQVSKLTVNFFPPGELTLLTVLNAHHGVAGTKR